MVTGNMAVLLLSCLFACLVVAQGVSRVEYSKKIQSSSRVELATIDEKVVNASLVEKIKGMAFGTGVNLTNIRKPYVEKSMQKMIETGVNYVHVSAYARMKSVFDLTRYTSTDEKDIRYQIRLAKRNGLRVFFKPVVEPDGSWRGFIPGRDLWLRADYKSFIVDMAKLAEEEEVELFAVGSEYAQSLSNEEGWRYVVEEVRKVYSGKLTYVGNHDSYQNCLIWDVLDVISISAYSILIPDGQTFGPSPDLHTTIALWEQQARDMNKWRIKAGYSKQQILIGEVGAQSKGGGIVYRKPFDWSTPAPPDQDEQAKMYEGILKAFMPKPWCMGVLLWHWELDPNPFPWSGYTPQGKLAEEVMTNYFNKTYSIEEAPKLH